MADSIGDSLKAGSDFMGSLTDAARKTAAYNVLNNTYGAAVADDPEKALNAQLYGQRQLTNPLDVEKKTLDNTGVTLDNSGKQQDQDFNALNNPLKLRGSELTNTGKELDNTKTSQDTAFAAQDQPYNILAKKANIAQSNAATNASNAETATRHFELNTAKAQADRTAAMGILSGLSDVATNGGDIGAAFDKYAPMIAKFQGTDVSHIQGLREKLVADPAGTINTMTDAVHAAQQTALGVKATSAAGIAAAKASDKAATQVGSMKAIAERTAAIPGLLDQADGLIAGMSPVAAVRVVRAKIPGTNEYNYTKLMESLTANLSLTDLQNMKNSGLSLGRVTNAEMAAAGHAYSNMDIGQDTSTIRGNLRRVGQVYKTVNDNLGLDIKRVEGIAARGAGGAKIVNPIPAPAGFKGVEGKTYTSADGSTAVFKNGKFIPQ